MASPDLLQLVLQQHGINVGGWGKAFCVPAAVCKVWRTAAQLVGARMECWRELRWRVEHLSKVPVDGYQLSPNTSAGESPYDWKLVIKDWSRAARPYPKLGLYLQVPNEDTLPEGWTRRAEFEITLHHPTRPEEHRTRYSRKRFSADCLDWGWGAHVTIDELPAFFDDKETLHVSARVRVHCGKLKCSHEAVMHARPPRCTRGRNQLANSR